MNPLFRERRRIPLPANIAGDFKVARELHEHLSSPVGRLVADLSSADGGESYARDAVYGFRFTEFAANNDPSVIPDYPIAYDAGKSLHAVHTTE